ncbi:MAG: hypothetical protein ABIG64_09495 [Candidatus Omnitrophota bacterium]
MKTKKTNKIFSKIIVLVIVQVLLLSNISWAQESSTLSPPIQININIFERNYQMLLPSSYEKMFFSRLQNLLSKIGVEKIDLSIFSIAQFDGDYYIYLKNGENGNQTAKKLTYIPLSPILEELSYVDVLKNKFIKDTIIDIDKNLTMIPRLSFYDKALPHLYEKLFKVIFHQRLLSILTRTERRVVLEGQEGEKENFYFRVGKTSIKETELEFCPKNEFIQKKYLSVPNNFALVPNEGAAIRFGFSLIWQSNDQENANEGLFPSLHIYQVQPKSGLMRLVREKKLFKECGRRGVEDIVRVARELGIEPITGIYEKAVSFDIAMPGSVFSHRNRSFSYEYTFNKSFELNAAKNLWMWNETELLKRSLDKTNLHRGYDLFEVEVESGVWRWVIKAKDLNGMTQYLDVLKLISYFKKNNLKANITLENQISYIKQQSVVNDSSPQVILQNLRLIAKGDFEAVLNMPRELIDLLSQVKAKDSQDTAIEAMRKLITQDRNGKINDIRSGVITLESPIIYNRLEIKALRLKGIYPQVENNQVLEYLKGKGKTPGVPTSDEYGRIINDGPATTSYGTTSYEDAKAELMFDQKLLQAGISVDMPLAEGYYNKITFNNQRVGFSIFGMEDEQDIRLKHSRDTKYLKQMAVLLRAMHDAGFAHRFPYFGNFGLVRTKQGEKLVIRDLECMIELNKINSSPIITYRWLDIQRILWDFLLHRQGHPDEMILVPTDRTVELVPEFVKGYFGENWRDYIDISKMPRLTDEESLGWLFNLEIAEALKPYLKENKNPRDISQGSIYKALEKIEKEKYPQPISADNETETATIEEQITPAIEKIVHPVKKKVNFSALKITRIYDQPEAVKIIDDWFKSYPAGLTISKRLWLRELSLHPGCVFYVARVNNDIFGLMISYADENNDLCLSRIEIAPGFKEEEIIKRELIYRALSHRPTALSKVYLLKQHLGNRENLIEQAI